MLPTQRGECRGMASPFVFTFPFGSSLLLLSLSFLRLVPVVVVAAASSGLSGVSSGLSSASSSSSSLAASLSLFLPLALLVEAATAAEPSKQITFLHINDHHSHIEPNLLTLRDGLMPEGLSVSPTQIRIRIGGAERIVTLLRQQKEYEQQTLGHDVCVLHAGDALTGSLFYTVYGVKVDAAWMNAANIFDFMTLGNHEFDGGDATLADFVKAVQFPVGSYNLRPHANSALSQLPESNAIRLYHIKTLQDGMDQLGICSITIKTITEKSSRPDPGTTLNDELQAAQDCVAELQSQGIDKIVLLTHTGYDMDLDSFSSIPGVDVIIGGHRHAFLGDTETFTPLGIQVAGPYATLRNGVCIVTAWEFNKLVGKLTVSFDSIGNVIDCQGQPLIPFDPTAMTAILEAGESGTSNNNVPVALSPEDATIVADYLVEKYPGFLPTEADPETSKSLEEFRAEINRFQGNVVATVEENICHTRRGDGADPLCPTKEAQSLVGGGVCIVVAFAYLHGSPEADFALQNAGGCRTDLRAGPLTLGNVFDMLPFPNTLVRVAMKGSLFREALEDSVAYFLDYTGGSGSYPCGANIRWDLNMTATYGSRFSNIEVKQKEDGIWIPFNPETTYLVATNDYVASGADGYNAFNQVNRQNLTVYTNTYIEYAQVFLNYASVARVIREPHPSDYSTQFLVDEEGREISIRALHLVTTEPTQAPTTDPAVPTIPTETTPSSGGIVTLQTTNTAWLSFIAMIWLMV